MSKELKDKLYEALRDAQRAGGAMALARLEVHVRALRVEDPRYNAALEHVIEAIHEMIGEPNDQH